MIKPTKEDLKFKKSAEYRDRKENILNASNITGMIKQLWNKESSQSR